MKYQAIDSDYIREMKERDEFLKQKNMMYKGLKYGYYLTIVIVILSAFFSGNLVLAQTSNINYEFQNGYVYDGVLPESSVLENMRNTTEPTGHFPATYSFENETVGTNQTDIRFVDDVSGGTVEIIEEIDGHNKVLNLTNDITKVGWTTDVWGEMIEGTIEFWYYVPDEWTDYYGYFYFYDNLDTLGLQGLQIGNDLKYRELDADYVAIYEGFIINQWYHVRFDINCTSDRFDAYINGVLEVDNGEFRNVVDNIAYMKIGVTDLSNLIERNVYFDAFGYSWDGNYSEHDTSEISFNYGSYTGNLNNVNIDDSNFITIDSELASGFNYIMAFFTFNESYPLNKAYLSYDMTSTINLQLWVGDLGNGDNMIDSGLSLDNDFLELVDPFTELFVFSLTLNSFTCLVYYLKLFIWLPNYNIGDNLISTKGTTNNTETDKFEFTFDSSANINVNGDDDVSGFTDIENDFWSNDVVNVIDSVDDDVDKAIRIFRAQLGNCGIQRDFDVGVNTSEVSWQLDLVQLGYPECQVYTKIENADSDIIAFFMLNGSYIPYGAYPRVMDLSYYYNSGWVLLESNIASGNNYNMTFVFEWTNGSDYGVLGFDGNNYYIPFENDQDSLGIFEIYAINDHNVIYDSIDIEIDWIRIIVNGTSLSDELMPENMFILTGEDVSLLYQPFIEITFNITYDNNVSIYLNDDIELIPYIYNVTAERIFSTNAHQDKSYSGLFLKIYNSTAYFIENIKVYGIQLVNQQDSSDSPFLEFDYSNVDPNISYFYVSGNDLYYHLETDDNGNLEYIQATFNINDFATEGYAVAFTHQKGNSYLQSECKVVFIDNTYLSFLSSNTTKAESLIMPQDKTIKELVFLVTDDNIGIIDTLDGYFSEISFIFYPDIETEITTLSLIEVLPIIILLTAVPIAIYYGFGKKKELIVPSLALMSIFAMGVGLIPIWLEVIIIFSCICYYVIQQKRGGI